MTRRRAERGEGPPIGLNAPLACDLVRSREGTGSILAERQPIPKKRKTMRASVTSEFGVSKRESHDASDFYARFAAPELSDDTTVNECTASNSLITGDARDMAAVEDNSVALCAFSPPYHAGKEYEAEIGVGHVPATYLDYLAMLRDVFAECRRVLEPGGRIAVNVANLGRKPYRSLSADVIRILQDDLGFLLRGEIIWQKAAGASGNCAWGSYMKASNPGLRDLTERVIVASKGRFDRAIPWQERQVRGLPWESTIERDEFMEATLDVWHIGTESAKRVGHPAPYPVELPRRLIELYTYKGDVVLDPFVGSGTTAVAAVRTGRKFVGYDVDADYIQLAETRVQKERAIADAAAAASAAASVAYGEWRGTSDDEQEQSPKRTA